MITHKAFVFRRVSLIFTSTLNSIIFIHYTRNYSLCVETGNSFMLSALKRCGMVCFSCRYAFSTELKQGELLQTHSQVKRSREVSERERERAKTAALPLLRKLRRVLVIFAHMHTVRASGIDSQHSQLGATIQRELDSFSEKVSGACLGVRQNSRSRAGLIVVSNE